MSKIYISVNQLIGHTPFLELTHIEAGEGLKARIFVKLEYFNPAGSVKDRVVRGMFDDAEQRGVLKKGSIIIEPTSGNTGISLASVAATRDYRIITVMPDSMNVERRNLMKAYDTELALTGGAKGMKGTMAKAGELAKEIPSNSIPGQFVDLTSPAIHEKTTGPEIWEGTDDEVDYFVSGVSTGGTLTGVGRCLRSKKPEVKLTTVEPDVSPVLPDGQPGPHKIQGLDTGFVPNTLDMRIYDEVIWVSDEDAFRERREIGRAEDILTGISLDAALYTAVQLAKRKKTEDKTIVVLLSDSGGRYLSSPLFQDWLRSEYK